VGQKTRAHLKALAQPSHMGAGVDAGNTLEGGPQSRYRSSDDNEVLSGQPSFKGQAAEVKSWGQSDTGQVRHVLTCLKHLSALALIATPQCHLLGALVLSILLHQSLRQSSAPCTRAKDGQTLQIKAPNG